MHPDGHSLVSFLGSLDRIPWLQQLGQPTARDSQVSRLDDWSQWPGPEDPDIRDLANYFQACHDEVLDRAGRLREEAEQLFERVSRLVHDRAKEAVPYDPDEDAWHGPTQCVWDVSSWAGLIAVYLLLGQEIPPEVQQVWSWVEAGHWPCGYARDGRLMVY